MPVFLEMSVMIVSILSRRLYLSLVNIGQWRKNWFNVSISNPQLQIGLSVSKKLCLNLCSLKWLRPTRRRVSKISRFGWLTLKTSLLRGLIRFKIFFLKVEYEGELQIKMNEELRKAATCFKGNKLRKVATCFKANKLSLNASKTKYFLFHSTTKNCYLNCVN